MYGIKTTKQLTYKHTSLGEELKSENILQTSTQIYMYETYSTRQLTFKHTLLGEELNN